MAAFLTLSVAPLPLALKFRRKGGHTWRQVDLTQIGREGVLKFSKALSGGDVRPNRVQPLINSRKGEVGKIKHLLRSMSYSKKNQKKTKVKTK